MADLVGDSFKTTHYDSIKCNDDSSKTIPYNKKAGSTRGPLFPAGAGTNPSTSTQEEQPVNDLLHIMDPIIHGRNICASTRAALYHPSQRSRLPEALSTLLATGFAG